MASSALALAIGFLSAQGVAAQVIWDGQTDTDWATATNWNGDVLPNNSATVQINNGGLANQPTLGAPDTVGSVTVSGGTLTISAKLNTTTGTIATGSGTINVTATGNVALGGMTNSGGTIDVAAGGIVSSFTHSSGTTTNAGVITQTLDVNGNGMTNSGTVNNAVNINAGLLTNDGNLGNGVGDTVTVAAGTGRLNNDATGVVVGTLTNNRTVVNDGTIGAAVHNAGTFTNNGQISRNLDVNGNGFTNKTTGTVNGNVAVNTGTLVNAGALGNAATDTVTVAAAGGLTVTSTGSVAGTLTNAGATTNAGTVNAVVHNGGTFSNTGTVTTTLTVNANGVTNQTAGTVNGNVAVNTGTLVNKGALGDAATDTVTVAAAGGLTVTSTGSVAGTLTNAGATTNAGTVNAVVHNGGTFSNTGTVTTTLTVNANGVTNQTAGHVNGNVAVNTGALINSGTLGNAAADTLTIAAAGTLTNNAGGNVIATTTNAGGVVNNGTMGTVSNSGTVTNNLTMGALTNTGAGAGGNTGTLASLAHNSTGVFDNAGAVNGATSVSNGTLNLNAGSNLADANALTVTGGIVNVNTAETVGALVANAGVTNLNATLTAGALSGTAGSIVGTAPAGLIAGNGANSTFGGVYSGTGSLQKIGTGTLELTNVNTYSLGTTVTQGVLSFTGLGAITGTNITIDPAGVLSTDGGALAFGAVIQNNGTSPGGALRLTLGGDESIASVSGAGTINLSSGSVLTLNTGASAISGVISGAGGLVVTGTSTTTLSGANTNTGPVEVAGGTLVLTGGFAIADLTNVATTAPGTLQVDSAETIGSLNGSGATVLNADLTTGGSDFTTAVSGAISGAGGLTKTGNGTMTLSGTNTFTGDMTIAAGTLAVTNGFALDDTVEVVVAGGATLRLDANEDIGALSAVAASAEVDVGANGLQIVGGQNTTYAGTLAGTGSVANNGSAKLTLTGDSTGFTGILGATGAGSEVAITGAGKVGAVGVGSVAGATFSTDGGAILASNAVLGADGQVTFTGSETVGTVVNSAANGVAGGTITLTGASTILTVNGSANALNPGGFNGTSGNINGTGSLNISGGTFTVGATGNVQTATTIGAAGIVVNNGTIMAAISNAGSFTNNLTAGALTNTGAGIGSNAGPATLASIAHNSTGTFTNSGLVLGDATVSAGTLINGGTISGTANVTSGTLSVVGGIITGTTTNNGGLISFSNGTFTGGLTNTTGNVEAQGALVGNVTNNASFRTTGATTGNAANVFINNATGTVDLTGSSMTNLLSFSNLGTTNVGAGMNLGAATLSNSGQMSLTSGTVTGAFTNLGTITNSGTSAIAGAFTNNGTVSMTDGVFGDSLSISGLTSGTAIYQLDLNLTTGASDVVHANGGTMGTITLQFGTTTPIGAIMPTATVLTGLSAGTTLNFTGLPFGGAILYRVNEAPGGNVEVTSGVNPAVPGVAASAAMTQSLIGTVVNRPTSPFVSGLAAEEGCSHGGYMRASAGLATVNGTTISSAGTNQSAIKSSFYGAQAGYDVGCFDGRFFNGWDGAAGLMLGYNVGSTDQNVYSDPLNPATITGVSGSQFTQSYVGLYVAGSKDRFSGDMQLRFDDTKFDLSETAFVGAPIGLDGLSYGTKTSTLGARFNYRFDLNEEKGINFIPTLGFNYSTTTGAKLTLDAANNETLEIVPFSTVVGFVGGTVAKTKISEAGDSALTTFASGNYYQDFGGDRSAIYNNAALPGPETMTIQSIGGFAEASVGVNYVKILDKGPGGAKQLNANLRADARFGQNVTDSFSITAQVRLSF